MSARAYGQHGRRHGGAGSDPIIADWVYVDDDGAPAFQNGWGNSGGTYVPMRYRFLPGKDSESDQPSVEIQGSATGGNPGTVIFTLPITLDYDLHLSASSDGGSFVVLTVQQSGDVVYGFV